MRAKHVQLARRVVYALCIFAPLGRIQNLLLDSLPVFAISVLSGLSPLRGGVVAQHGYYVTWHRSLGCRSLTFVTGRRDLHAVMLCFSTSAVDSCYSQLHSDTLNLPSLSEE